MPPKEPKARAKGAGRFKGSEENEFKNVTPAGHLKDFDEPMASTYSPIAVESAWDAYWNKQGLYSAEADSKRPAFTMVIPPPNVTGTLHLGHALMVSIEDCLTRWKRMQGFNALWLPGTDHAGIATQVVVEKKLMREEAKSRHDYGRTEFIKKVWSWKEAHGNRIYEQMRRMGASVDWSREHFTMDETLSKAVKEAFVRMYDDGKIYRANRLVNWSCTLRTAISAIEVDHMELDGPTELSVPGYERKIEFGVLHKFAYPLADGQDVPKTDDEGKELAQELVVATTRLETMLGDVAVAVHPDDLRYTHLHGKLLQHPFLDRKIPVITDSILVDMKFGTGAVKITPAHDENDFKCGQRHKLEQINILTDEGDINAEGGEYEGRQRFLVRYDLIEDLTKLGLFRGKDPNPMSVGLCSRSKDVIEKVLRPQWWVDCKDMANKAVAAVAINDPNPLSEKAQAILQTVRDQQAGEPESKKEVSFEGGFGEKGGLELLPAGIHHKTWYNWMCNIEDWCISRQLWWGHRVPAYFVSRKDDEKSSSSQARQDKDNWVAARSEEEALERAAAKWPDVPKDSFVIEQDPDVLDTWFSSGLFPFSTVGWPEKTADLRSFFPGDLLETGHDILFFWVARMVMMSLELTGKLPFHSVYLHAMVRDSHGRKMSKSRGNVIDPIDVMEGVTLEKLQQRLENSNLDPKEIKIAKDGQKGDFPQGIAQCGADALRFGLLSYTVQGRSINLDINRVVVFRQFCNKMWNATKFLLGVFPKDFVPTFTTAALEESLKAHGEFEDRWILHRAFATIREANETLEKYEFGTTCSLVHRFWMEDFCAVYVELSKRRVYGYDEDSKTAAFNTLYACLDVGLRLLHPMMPFVTEELFHRLPSWSVRFGKDAVQYAEQDVHKDQSSGSIMVQPYPSTKVYAGWEAPETEDRMQLLQAVATASRSLRAQLQINKVRTPCHILTEDKQVLEWVAASRSLLCVMAQVESVHEAKDASELPVKRFSAPLAERSDITMHVPLDKVPNWGKLLVKIRNGLDQASKGVKQLKSMMDKPNYESKTPEKVRLNNVAKLQSKVVAEKELKEAFDRLEGFLSDDKEQRTLYYTEQLTSLSKEQKKLEKNVKKLSPKGDKKLSDKKQAKLDTAQAALDEVVERISDLQKKLEE